jgi:hypothetical protein
MDLLPYLSDLGINAVELLPMSEFSGALGWATGTLITPSSSRARAVGTGTSISCARATATAWPSETDLLGLAVPEG